LTGVAYSSSLNIWVGGGFNLTAYSNDDGITWITVSSPVSLTRIVWSEDKQIFVAVDPLLVASARSIDGINWSIVTVRPGSIGSRSITYF
jgi:hypothetical protein